jgi:hypothetical protein
MHNTGIPQWFGRIQYNWQDEYLLSLTGEEMVPPALDRITGLRNLVPQVLPGYFPNTFKDHLAVLSFGKIRASYGSTGNDQITDYQYLPTWRGTPNPYQGVSGLMPTRLFNPNHRWEVNRKLEAAVELGFFKDPPVFNSRLLPQPEQQSLVDYPLPGQTGFSSVTENLQALVQNTGVEIELRSTNITSGDFNWQTYGNITIPRNKLISFPGLAYSSYAYSYVIGKPLSILNRYHSLGVDPATGVYQFEDVNKDGVLSPDADLLATKNLDPVFYGGLGMIFSIRDSLVQYFSNSAAKQDLIICQTSLQEECRAWISISLLLYWSGGNDQEILLLYKDSAPPLEYLQQTLQTRLRFLMHYIATPLLSD